MPIKMTVTPTTIFFEEMSDHLLNDIPYPFEVHRAPKGYKISGTPEKLYLLIVELSQNYDIEII